MGPVRRRSRIGDKRRRILALTMEPNNRRPESKNGNRAGELPKRVLFVGFDSWEMEETKNAETKNNVEQNRPQEEGPPPIGSATSSVNTGRVKKTCNHHARKSKNSRYPRRNNRQPSLNPEKGPSNSKTQDDAS